MNTGYERVNGKTWAFGISGYGTNIVKKQGLNGLNFPQKRVKIFCFEAILRFLPYLAIHAKRDDKDIRVGMYDGNIVKLYHYV
jgi:hypothetical protein